MPAPFDDVVQRAMARTRRTATRPRASSACALAARTEQDAPAPERLRPAPACSRATPVSEAREPQMSPCATGPASSCSGSPAGCVAGGCGRGGRCARPDRMTRRPTARYPDVAAVAARRPRGARCRPMPTARQNMAGTVVDGTIWVVGGLGHGQRVAAGRGLRPGRQRLEGRSRPAVRLHHEMVVTYRDELVVMGGWIPKGSDPSAEIV